MPKCGFREWITLFNIVCMYIWGFRACQHPRSLVPVMNYDDDNDGQMIFGDLGGLNLPDIYLQMRKNPKKTTPRKLVPTGDRTQACCVTGTHATTWPLFNITTPQMKELCSTHTIVMRYVYVLKI